MIPKFNLSPIYGFPQETVLEILAHLSLFNFSLFENISDMLSNHTSIALK